MQSASANIYSTEHLILQIVFCYCELRPCADFLKVHLLRFCPSTLKWYTLPKHCMILGTHSGI